MTPGPHPVAGPERLEVRVRGYVQGVGFRYFARREARRLGLTGWVANDADGSVEVIAEGPRSDLEQFADALAVGPAGASVADVEATWGAATGEFDEFSVRSGFHSGD